MTAATLTGLAAAGAIGGPAVVILLGLTLGRDLIARRGR